MLGKNHSCLLTSLNSLAELMSMYNPCTENDDRCVQDFYGLTLDALKEAKNDRLWFKTQLKLCGLWFKLKEYARGAKILRELHKCALSSWFSPENDLVPRLIPLP